MWIKVKLEGLKCLVTGVSVPLESIHPTSSIPSFGNEVESVEEGNRLNRKYTHLRDLNPMDPRGPGANVAPPEAVALAALDLNN